MYAVVFDMDTDTLKNAYAGQSWQNAYQDIRTVLSGHGFEWKQGSTYFGAEDMDAVKCVLAVQDLARQYSWFAAAVRDVRMLRIEENNDLTPAIEAVA